MDTSFVKEYKNWISNLSKANFDELVLNYNKEYYNTKNIYISDGPYDGGIDLIISKDDGTEIKRNIQITVQENNYEGKLKDDLKKSKENVDSFNYLNTLDFYISQPISPEKKKKLTKHAEVEYQITLRFFDSNKLAGLADEYRSIKDTIHRYSKLAFPDKDLQIDSNTKILFDTISMSRDVTNVKNSFVHSMILTHLFNNPEKTVADIYTELKSVFFDKFDRVFFEKEIGVLKSTSRILDIENTNPKKFDLTEETRQAINDISERAIIHEQDLITEIENVLARYKIESESTDLAKYIIELYHANYEIDEAELLKGNSTHNSKINSIFSTLTNHLISSHGINKNDANDIARQLLVKCSKNEFLNKTSISKMFTNLFKSDKLEKYLSTSKRKVYLDTQILLQIICCNYDEFDYDDSLYKAVKYFNDTIENSEVPIEMYTTIGYVEEVAWHIINGLKLERFLELDFVRDLGPSKNVFFNYFLELKQRNSEMETFSEFIEDLIDVQINKSLNRTFAEEVIQNLVDRLNLLGIEVDTPTIFENYDKYRKSYEVSLSYIKHDQKTYEARKHDLNTILHLSQLHTDFDDEGLFTEPFFITWDTSFYEVRKDFQKFKELNYWFLYPPMKFANTVEVVNMKIDSTAINYNVVSLVEENFNLSNDAISFIDLINGIFQETDVRKWKLVSKLAKLRKKLLNESQIEDFSKTRNNSLPIDELLLLLIKHYQSPSNSKNYRDLVSLFQNNDYADRIAKLIEDNIDDFHLNHKIKPSIVSQIDKMIQEITKHNKH